MLYGPTLPYGLFPGQLAPTTISLGLPLFTEELDAGREYFSVLLGAYRELGGHPRVFKQHNNVHRDQDESSEQK